MTSLDLGDKFDTSNVTSMSYMFQYCGKKFMTSLDLGDKFDTSKVTAMNSMFMYCGSEAMTSLDLGDKFNTSNVTSMTNMFYACGRDSMTTLDLGPAFTKIAEDNTDFLTAAGKSGACTIYAPESIYKNKKAFKLNSTDTTETPDSLKYTRGTINPIYKPEWEKVSSSLDETNKTLNAVVKGSAYKTKTIQVDGVDKTETIYASDVTSHLAKEHITVYVDGVEVTNTVNPFVTVNEPTTSTKEVTVNSGTDTETGTDTESGNNAETGTNVEAETKEITEVTHTITLSNLEEAVHQTGKPYKEWSGNIAIRVGGRGEATSTYASPSLVDIYGNQSMMQTDEGQTGGTWINLTFKDGNITSNTNGTMFADYVKPEFTYRYNEGDINYGDKTLKVVFDVTDKYFSSTDLSTDNNADLITVKVSEDAEANNAVAKTLTKKNELILNTQTNTITAQEAGYTLGENERKIGERYELVIEKLQQDPNDGFKYSGIVTLGFRAGIIEDTSGNQNNATIITIGVNDEDGNTQNTQDPNGVIVDVVDPIWEQKEIDEKNLIFKLIAKDKYFDSENSNLIAEDIKIYLNGVEITTAEAEIINTADILETIDGVPNTVVGREYTIKLLNVETPETGYKDFTPSNLETDNLNNNAGFKYKEGISGNLAIEIPGGTIKDQSNNTSQAKTFDIDIEDNTKPEAFKVQEMQDTENKTETITFNVTDKNYDGTANSITLEQITVLIDGTPNNSIKKSNLTSKPIEITENGETKIIGHQYTVVLSNIVEETRQDGKNYLENSGTVGIKIEPNAVIDKYGNKLEDKAINGFVDFIKPELRYTHQSTDINTGSKRYTMTFVVTDKYYTSGVLELADLSIKMKNGQKDAKGNEIVYDLRQLQKAGEISLSLKPTEKKATFRKTVDGVLEETATEHVIGHTYVLTVSGLDRAWIKRGQTTANYSGTITVGIEADKIQDNGTAGDGVNPNGNNATKITAGVNITEESGNEEEPGNEEPGVVVDVVSPLITRVSSSASAIDPANKESSIAKITFKGTDTYFKESTLTIDDIKVVVDGEEVTDLEAAGITKTLDSTKELKENRIVDGVEVTDVQYGVQYAVTIKGFAQGAKQVKVRIPAGKLIDETGNSNRQTDIIIYSTLKSAASETDATSPFLGGPENIQRQDIENITFVNNTSSGLIRNYDAKSNALSGHDDSATTWRDSTRNKDAIVNGGTWGDNYLQLNGVGDWANLGEVNLTSQVTLKTTIMINEIQDGERTILSNSQEGGVGLYITSGVPKFQVYIEGIGYVSIEGSEAITVDEKTRITATYDGNYMSLYVNGELVAQKAQTGKICAPQNNTVMAIGANPNGDTVEDDSFANIKVYSVRIYNRRLSQTELRQLETTEPKYASWDVSALGDGSITAWTYDTSAPYTVYIGSSYDIIFANQDSTNLFRYIGYGENCTTIEAVTNLNLLNVKSVTNMQAMFNNFGYRAMESLILPTTFDTSNVTNMNSMFGDCGYTAMTNLVLPNTFNTTNVTDMGDMFNGCGYTKITSLDLGDKFNTSNVTNMAQMFNECGKLNMTTLDLGPFFTKIAETNTDFLKEAGKPGECTIYAPESIYKNKNAFKLNSTDTTETPNSLKYTRGTINPIYKPEWEKVSSSIDTENKTLSVVVKGSAYKTKTEQVNGVDKTETIYASNVTSRLSKEHITVFVDGVEVTKTVNPKITVNAGATSTNSTSKKTEVTHTIKLSNLEEAIRQTGKPYKEWSGNIAIRVGGRGKATSTYTTPSLVDIYGNQSMMQTDENGTNADGSWINVTFKDGDITSNTNGTMFADYVKPEFTYRYNEGDINYGDKTLKVVFDVTDKYFSSSGLAEDVNAQNITVNVSEYDDANNAVTKTLTKTHEIILNIQTNTVTTQEAGYTLGENERKIGERYELLIEKLEQTPNDGFKYSGIVSLGFGAGIIEDTSGNQNNATKITIGVNDTDGNTQDVVDPNGVIVDVVDPAWTKVSSTASAIDPDNKESSTATITFRGTDKYFKESTLTIDDIQVVVNGEEVTDLEAVGITKTLDSSETVQNGVEYTVTIKGFAQDVNQVKLRIPAGKLTDETGNSNKLTDLIVYNVLKYAGSEQAETSPFLGESLSTTIYPTGLTEVTPIARQDIERVEFASSIAGSKAPEVQRVWDVSAQGDKSIIAWTEQTQAPYTVYIGSNDEIFANQDSNSLLKYIGHSSKCSAREAVTNLELLNVKSVTNMKKMFQNLGRYAMKSLILPNTFDTSNVINMEAMFGSCGQLAMTKLELGTHFNTSNVTNMALMFNNCGGHVTEVDLSSGTDKTNTTQFDTKNVTDMSRMFVSLGGSKLTKFNLGNNFDTSNVTNMSNMFFAFGHNLTSLDLGDKFDTSKVAYMTKMFYRCGGVNMTTIDLGPAFTNIGKYNTNFLKETGKPGECTIYAPESIYKSKTSFKLNSTDTTETPDSLKYTRGTINPIYKPGWEKVSDEIDTEKQTLSVTVKGSAYQEPQTMDNGKVKINYASDVTSKLSKEHITVYIDGVEVTNTVNPFVTVNSGENSTNATTEKTEVTHTITLSNLEEAVHQTGKPYKEWSGNIAIRVGGRGEATSTYTSPSLVDIYGNQSMMQTDENGTNADGSWINVTFSETEVGQNTENTMFMDYIKPEFTYQYNEGDINYNDKTLKVVFDVADKYFSSSSLSTDSNASLITVKVSDDEEANNVVTKTLTKTHEIILNTQTNTVTEQEAGYTLGENERKVGERYELLIENLQQNPNDGFKYSGIVKLGFGSGIITDTSGNTNNATKITIVAKESAEESQGTTYAKPSELFDLEGTNPDRLHIGDFVNYDAGTWTLDEIKAIKTGDKTTGLVTARGSTGSTAMPDKAFQFGGFIAGSSRNETATPFIVSYNGIAYGTYVKDASTNKAITGWRVFDINDDGTVILISAVNPENYNHVSITKGGFISEYILTGNVNGSWKDGETESQNYQKRDWSIYENYEQKAVRGSATVLTKSRLDDWYTKYTNYSNADTLNLSTFQKIYTKPEYHRYQNMIDNYSYYWVPSPANYEVLYFVYPTRRGVGNGGYKATGVRVLVTLSDDVRFTSEKVGTKTVTGGNTIEYGGDQTYNVWGIKHVPAIVDVVDPIWKLGEVDKENLTLKLIATDKYFDSENSSLTAEDITIYVNGVEATEVVKDITSIAPKDILDTVDGIPNSVVGREYTLNLLNPETDGYTTFIPSNLQEDNLNNNAGFKYKAGISGNIAIEIAEGAIKDKSNNTSKAETFNMNIEDNTKPEIFEVEKIQDTSAKTETIIFNVTDQNYDETDLITSEEITVLIDGTQINSIDKSNLTSKPIKETKNEETRIVGHQYTLVLSNIVETTRQEGKGYLENSGTLEVKIAENAARDLSGNKLAATTIKDFVDFIKPELRYTHQSTDINTGTKTYTMTFEITDKYYTSGELALADLTIKMKNGQKDSNGNEIVYDLNELANAGEINMTLNKTPKTATFDKTVNNAVVNGTYAIGHTYTLTVSNLEKVEIKSGLTTADYSGIITVGLAANMIKDNGPRGDGVNPNGNNATTITAGVNIPGGSGTGVVVDVVAPVWTKVSSTAYAIDPDNKASSTATITFKGTDTYFKESTLTMNDIKVLVNGAEVTSGITKVLDSTRTLTEDRIENGANKTGVPYGVEYTITIKGFAQDANQVKIRIPAGKLTDKSGNSNKETDLIVYNTLRYAGSEDNATSPFLGSSNLQGGNVANPSAGGSNSEGSNVASPSAGGSNSEGSINIARQDIENVTFVDNSRLVSGLVRGYDAKTNTISGHNNSTTTWRDLSGTQDGILNGGTWSNDYLSLDGVDDCVNLGEVDLTDQVTLDATIEANEIQDREVEILCNYENGGVGLYLYNGIPGFGPFITEVGNYVNVMASKPVTVGEKTRITGTYDGTNISLYINGKLEAQKLQTGTIKSPDNNTVMAIGANMQRDIVENGWCANINVYSAKIYNIGLTQSEVALAETTQTPYAIWDVSAQQDRSIMAWTYNTSAPYTVYIGSNDEIFANQDSGRLFSYIGAGTNCTAEEAITNLNLLNVKSVKVMRGMFYYLGFKAMTSFSLPDTFDTSNVIDMRSMFTRCGYYKMTSFDLGNKFDTSNVTSMYSMFNQTGCNAMTSLDLGDKFNTRNVTSMKFMFYNTGNNAMTSLDLGDKFDTSNVINMYGMFQGCGQGAMTSLDLGDKFNTSKVTDMQKMFDSCGYTAMTSLDLGDLFYTTNVKDMYKMFNNCGKMSMTSLDLGPAFTKIPSGKITKQESDYESWESDKALEYNAYDDFMTDCGTSSLVIYAPETIYLDQSSFKLNKTGQ